MAMSLTQAQAELLAFIERYQDENGGVSPSCEEMRQGIGIASKSGVHRLLTALQERGRIYRPFHRVRAIEILRKQPERPPIETFTSNELVAELARRGALRRQAA